MDDLLKNAMRMRPDRIIMGEVRGGEALTLFTAMDTGHQGILGTLHANTSKESIIRLKAEPMAVPEAMIPLLDLILVQYRQYSPTQGMIRRVSQVAEISGMDERVLLSNLYEWDRKKDSILLNDIPSHVMETLSEKAGIGKKELIREMTVRQRILEWMTENKFHASEEVEKVIQAYYVNPTAVIEMVAKGKPEILNLPVN